VKIVKPDISGWLDRTHRFQLSIGVSVEDVAIVLAAGEDD